MLKPIYIILLFALFSITFEQYHSESLTINGKEETFFDKTGSISFSLKVENKENIKPYLKIAIKSSNNKNQVAILSENQKCESGRKLLAMQPYGPVQLFINKKQLENNLFLCVQCLEPNCKYSIELKYENTAKLKIGEQYSYYVNSTNTEMQFELEVNTQTANLRKLSTVNVTHNIWVKGEHAQVSVDSNYKAKEVPFKYGKIYKIKYESFDSYKFTIKSENGDYITIGSIEINNNVAPSLKVNDNEVMAVLSKNGENEICFPKAKLEVIKESSEIVYINGIVFSKKLKTYYKEDGKIDPFSNRNITDGNIIEGIYYDDYAKQNKYYCAALLDDKKDDVVFSIQLSSNKHIVYNQFIYPPQYPGIIYPHFLLKNEIALFQGMKPTKGATEINFNMKAIMGFPDMLYDNCTTYPNCTYNDSKLNDVIDPHHSNRMSVFSFYLKDEREITPISIFQPLMIVKCREGTKYKDRTSDYCIFETAIFTNKDRLILKETETFSQLLLKNESDLYTVDFENEDDVKKIQLDLTVFSGDVRFKIEGEDKIKEIHKYFLANKIFYCFHPEHLNGTKKIEFKVVAEKNSFYTISYQLVKSNEENINIRESGVNFVESISIGEYEKDYKIIYLQNVRNNVGTPFLASFYSKNCKFLITRVDDPNNPQYLDVYGDFAQVIIKEDDPYYYNNRYAFQVQFLTTDVSYYDKKVCMVYVSGLELENKNSAGQRTISLSEGVPHSFVFSQDYYSISYSYHITDTSNAVVIDFNLIDKSTFKVNIRFNYHDFQNYTIYRNQQVFILSKELAKNCEKDEVCTINIFIQQEQSNSTLSKLPKRLETTITQLNGAPIYLSKNILRKDFLVGDHPKYFYLDIGSEEMGDISINYKRNSGNIYAKIVKKDELKEDKNANWRGIYTFPRTVENTLRYETYLKKIFISPDNTKECTKGCYVLITVQSSNVRDLNYTDEKNSTIPYSITITPRIIQSNLRDYTHIPKVTIPLNEYIIGNIEISNDNETLYYYYDVMLPFESEYLMIDWQAVSPVLLINVGIENPSINKYDFRFNSTDNNRIIRISKVDLINKYKNKLNYTINMDSIRYLNLSLAIYTPKIDSIYTSIYAFKLFMPPTYHVSNTNEKLAVELIHIRSDQKVQCDPGEAGLCLFAVIFDEGDIGNHLIVHPRAQNDNSDIMFWGDLYDSYEIERNNITYIANMDEKKGQYNSLKRNYIYIKNIPKDKCLVFLVHVSPYSIIEVLSSTSKDFSFTPNPSTAQLFTLQSKKNLFLNFQTTQDLLINIACVSGEGFFRWDGENRKYHLSGSDDRLTLTSGTHNNSLKLSSLIATANDIQPNKLDDSGFVFYITHYPRTSSYNMDQVKVGRSTEFNYRDIKFPLNFYTPLKDRDITVSFNFYNFYSKNQIITKPMQYNGPLFKIWAYVFTLEEALYARIDPSFKPVNFEFSANGTFDAPFGVLYLNQSTIQQFDWYNKTTTFALFFTVEMLSKIDHEFNGASLEVSLLKEQNTFEANVSAPENVYLNGKLSQVEVLEAHYFRHKLKMDPNKNWTYIEFAANSKDIQWFVSPLELSDEPFNNFADKSNITLNGRQLLIFRKPEDMPSNYLYLVVYNFKKSKDNPINSKLANYVFKYNNLDKKIDLNMFKIENPKIEVTNTTSSDNKVTYNLKFDPALKSNSENEAVSYYVKGIYNDSFIKGEDVNSIAISESDGVYLQSYNTTPTNGKIELKLENVQKKLAYIKVLAKITQNAINEYLLYDTYIIGKNIDKIDNKTNPDNKNKTKDNTTNPDNKNKTKDNTTNPDNKNKTKDNTTNPDNKNKTKDNTTNPDNKNKNKDNTTNPDNKNKNKDNPTNPKQSKTPEATSKESDNKSSNYLIIIIIVGGVIFGIIIILLIVVCVFNQRNKNLMKSVQGISFAEEDRKNNLLIGEDNNELK